MKLERETETERDRQKERERENERMRERERERVRERESLFMRALLLVLCQAGLFCPSVKEKKYQSVGSPKESSKM